MKTILLKGIERTEAGTASAKRLREEGQVPCVVYSKDEHVSFSLYRDDLKNLIYTPNTYLVQLEIGDKTLKAVTQEVQFHPVNDTVIHIDFIAVDEAEPVTVPIPVRTLGNSPGVREGGRLALKLKKVRVKGLLNDIPEAITIDISDLQLGKSIKVAEVNIDNIEILEASNVAIVGIDATRSTRQAANEAMGIAPGEEGEEAATEGEGGEAAAE